MERSLFWTCIAIGGSIAMVAGFTVGLSRTDPALIVGCALCIVSIITTTLRRS